MVFVASESLFYTVIRLKKTVSNKTSAIDVFARYHTPPRVTRPHPMAMELTHLRRRPNQRSGFPLPPLWL